MWQNELEAMDFAGRRARFLKAMKSGVAVFPSAQLHLRNRDVHHPYRQDTSFQYLTGFPEAHSLCLLAAESKTPFQLFVEPRTPERELWEGKLTGPEEARRLYGANAAFPSSPASFFDEAFVTAMLDADRLYYRVGMDRDLDARIFSLLQKAGRKQGRTGRSLPPIHDPEEILGEMRLFKSRAEIQRLQNAAHISAEAHASAMRIAKPGMSEYEIEAVLYHAFRVHGAARVGYNTIVASGPNACVLHYTENRRRMEAGDLLLVDAGAEFDYYTADITRTFPVGGSFSEAQREIYTAVLRAQKEAIAVATLGKTLATVHERATECLVEELRRLKILKGTTKQCLKSQSYRAYAPHATSHWLGMDVHDAGRYVEGDTPRPRKLQAGMVFTIEPGLYFAPESGAPDRYKGIGVRIEDDILMTSKGPQILTSGVPKEVDEVESLCSPS